MAEVKFNKGSDEWKMFVDFWNMCQRHWKIEDTDEYWEFLIDETNKYCKQYACIPLAKELGIAFINAQEKVYKKGIENGKR